MARTRPTVKLRPRLSLFEYKKLANCSKGATIVIMGQQLDLGWASRWVAVTSLLGSMAAISLPGSTSQIAGIAVILAVAALAMLAGHRWSLIIIVAAQIMILGKVWPIAFHAGSTLVAVAAIVATVCALPGLILLRKTVPTTVELFAGKRSRRVNNMTYRVCSVLVAVWLLMPVVA